MKRWMLCLAGLTLAGSLVPGRLVPGEQPTANQPTSPPATPAPAESFDEARERQVMERFLTVLEKNPRRGTALDRVYGYHVERGTLDQLVKRYKDLTAKDPKDGTAWMIVSLIESQRGRDAAAVAAFKEAEKHLPENAIASYYLGQSLVLVGQPDLAAEAFERAISRKPAPADLLDIFQALGRVYQRAQRHEQALAVWDRLEKLFPDDLRVQEQIASTLAEEGQHEQALPRYEKLIKNTKDKYRQSLFRIEAAELRVRLGQSPKALIDFENLLGELNSDSWLYREVRRKVEEVFLRSDDQAGLAKYYESWIAKNEDDVESMARLARILATQGRVPEAQQWLEKALKLAPSRKELRLAFIEQLVYEKKYREAIAQYEALDKVEPKHPDYLREWGKLLLKDTSRPEAERKSAAAAVWNQLRDAKPKDPVVATQVADLFRQAEMSEEALALYRTAVELGPDQPQYREYLGEYYHNLKRSDEALATWRQMAAGTNRNAKNLARLGEVLAGFGYLKEAVAEFGEAVTLDKDDFTMRLKYSDLLHQSERFDDALQQLAVAGKLAANVEEAEAVLQGQIKNYQATDKLTAQIEALQKELKAGTDTTAKRWFLLARYLEAARQMPEATQAIKKSLELDGQSIPALTTAARVAEAEGNLLAAADMNRKLANVDRRYRTEYLTNVAKLEARLGRKEQALQAGRDLLAAAPGNPDHYQFFADLCFQLGENDDGFDALRRSVRVNPTEPKVVLALAQALAERFRTDEAIELYWRAFEKAGDMDNKLPVVQRLTELYMQTNHLDRLLERLERERREQGKQRETTICIAQAYHAAGDYGTARQELERLLAQNNRDTQLLQQLSNLSENEGDLASAVKYQQQLHKLAPGKEAETRLATLLLRSGDTEEASALLVRMTTHEQDPERVLKALDNLLANGKHDLALAITERLRLEQPRNWELLYREGVSLAKTNKHSEAAGRFQTILDLRLSDDEEGVVGKARKKPTVGRPTATSASRPALMPPNPIQSRSEAVWQIRIASGLDSREQYYGPGGGSPVSWGPADYGQARMAALGWQLSLAQKQGKQEDFLKQQRAARDKEGPDWATLRGKWDWYYLQLIRNDQRETYEATKLLSKTPDATGQWLYLAQLGNRMMASGRYYYGRQTTVDNTPPLPAEELDHVLACFRNVQKQRPDLLGQVGGYNPYSGYAQLVTQNVLAELKRAKRTQEEEQIYREAVAAANRPETVNSVLTLAAGRGDMDTVFKLFEKLERLQASQTSSPYSQPYTPAPNALAQVMNSRAEAKAHGDILNIFDRYLAYVIRQKKAAASTKSRASTGPYYYGRGYGYQVWVGKNMRQVQVDFPSPNEYYDYGLILLLREAFELYKRDDLLSDLFKHLQAQPAPTVREGDVADADRVYARLGLGYLHWWNDEKDQAVRELTAACGVVPADVNLRLEIAQLREQQGEFDEALELADAITPLDHTTMQKRETLALRVAVRTGNVERARQAADRLFGLRLDAETQVQLAAQMRQLGMHEGAEAVLGRARRQAGNRTAALVNLMNQYQNQNRQDLALQVAYQLLRRGPSQNAYSPYRYYRGYDDSDYGRQQAIQVLARSGKLKDMIERAEAQLKLSPKSIQILQTLAEYYRTAGDRAKLKEAYDQMAKIKPDDAKIRYQVAQQLHQSGETAAAIEHYTAALKKEPALFQNNYWELQQLYRQANKLDELVKIFEETDIRAMGNYWTVINLVQMLTQDEKSREQGMKLFRKAWQAFPDQRSSLISGLYNEEQWQLPEIYDYARQAIIPASDAVFGQDPWGAVQIIHSYTGDGRVTGVLSRVLDVASKQNRLEALAQEVDAALKKQPTWRGGRAMLSVIRVRQGRTDEAKKTLEELLDDKQNPMPMYARWIIGQELENYAVMQPLALRLYETTADDNLDQMGLQYSYSPSRRLVTLLQKAGRAEDARALCLKFAQSSGDSPYDPGYGAYRQVENVTVLGQQLLDLGYPVDAVRLYNEVLSDPAILATANMYYGGGGDQFTQQVQQGFNRAVQGLKPELLPRALRELIKPNEAVGAASRAAPGVRLGSPDLQNQAIDLVVLVQPRELNRAGLMSMFATAIRAAASKPELQAEVKASLGDLVKRRPQDLSVQIAAALAACAEGQSDAIALAAVRLEKLVEQTPLEELAPGQRANARQRAEAAKQLGLWLVARECFKHEALKPSGEKLALRALEAARRQTDTGFALAILREWGQLDLDKGDRKAAEQRWAQMLELVLPKPPPPKPAKNTGAFNPGRRQGDKETRGQGDTETGGHGDKETRRHGEEDGFLSLSPCLLVSVSFMADEPKPAPAPAPAKPAAKPTGPLVPAATLPQFQQAVQVARLAADHDMASLSLRAIRDALRGGPPVQIQPTMRGGPVPVAVGPSGIPMTQDQSNDPGVSQAVEEKLAEIDQLWKRKKLAAEQVYEVLAGVVLPEARPGEIFLYARPLAQGPGAPPQPRSVGKLVARWAVAAGKTDDLRRRIEARQGQPLAELPAHVLLAQLGLAAKDVKFAGEQLDWLGQRMQKEVLQNTSELACHVALPALDSPELAKAALPVVERAVKNLAGGNPNEEPLGSLLMAVARFQFKQGNAAEGRKQLREYLLAGERMNVRYGGDYGLYRRKEQLARVAGEFARAAELADALDMLGQFSDAPRYRYGEPSVSGAIAAVTRQLALKPAAEQYQLLTTWTLPAENRKSVRLLAAFLPSDGPPIGFQPSAIGDRPSASGHRPSAIGEDKEAADALPKAESREPKAEGVASSAALLLGAARELGKLDELADEVQKLAVQKVENAQMLLVLVQSARGKGETVEPQVKELVAARKTPAVNVGDRTGRGEAKSVEWPDFLVARACVADPKLREQGLELTQHLLEQSKRAQDHTFMGRLRQLQGIGLAARHGADQAPGRDSGLALWHPASHVTAATHQAGAAPIWWSAAEGHVTQLAGPEQNFLYFDLPLAGTFEFTVDAYCGSWAEGNVSYGGLAFDAMHLGAEGTIWPVGRHEQISRNSRPYTRTSGFNQVTIQVSPEKLRVLLNGRLFYEEKDPSPTSPWLAVYSSRERQTYFRNLAIKGKPEIPREVRLTHTDRLEGWVSSFYNETQPPRRSIGQPGRNYDRYGRPMPTELDPSPDAYDWSARDGVIHGRRLDTLAQADPLQSRLYYHRPLRDGESVSYEFYYEPGSVETHPAIGRLTFLLEPAGVRLHWITDGPDDVSGLSPGNIADEPANRRAQVGPASRAGPPLPLGSRHLLPLKPGDWNAVKLSLAGGKLALELNGEVVYERELESENERLFGFFHYKDRTAVQVRKVVLRGNWPEALPAGQLANLLAPANGSATPADRMARHDLISEPIFALSTFNVWEQARALPAKERYELLLAWVLPNDDHKAWRLYADFTPTDPVGAASRAAPAVRLGSPDLPSATGVTAPGDAAIPDRVHTGGELVSPALELIATVKELGKLDELAEQINKASVRRGPPEAAARDQRGQVALRALVAAAQGREDEAAKALQDLLPLLTKLPENAMEYERWPELLAAAGTLERPKLHSPAMALLDHVVVNQLQKPNTTMPKRAAWERQVRHLRSRGQVLALAEPQRKPFGTDPGLASWSPVTHATAESRGVGEALPHWSFHNGEVRHYTGHARDYLYLNVPLRGNFEINCELTSFGWREAQLSYGGIRPFLVHDLKRVNLEHYDRPIRTINLEPPLEKVGDWYAFRLVVQDGLYTAYANGRKLCEERLPAETDPWLAIYQLAYLSGGARNLKITGNPTVPAELQLSALPDLSGWLAGYYGESVGGENAPWQKRGEEIYGAGPAAEPAPDPSVTPARPEKRERGFQESLLQYHRPLLEAGEIEYEFFYEPGKVHVHPALDRLVLLLQPDGVKVHWLTDGVHDRTGLLPDNVATEPANRRGPEKLPLKERAWNRLQVSLAGNKVTLRLNDVEVYQRALEPTNQRLFGLFHYADETEVRVRNVIYRGQWPKKLPEDLFAPAGKKT